ncbi:MAG: Fe3+/spermidine/putrescine ABC transporter ATP-binding protein [Methanobacteriales archaeon HGW-Methanobacteriales-1]|jgi:molybdopterin-binding protein|nr:MAG: Fe3+/spermidine/putrescine ABC transporter ATP-binding protein [Methanobacteriales archaeon HGW-Methanobacteriales-1]
MFLEVKDLNVDLGEFYLKNASLSLEKQEYLVLIGPTGSGKSVLLETIAGFYKAKSGQVLLNSEDITNLSPENRGISIVYQDNVLFPHMNVYENIAYGLKKQTDDKELIQNKVHKMAEILKIDHILNRNIKTLSGGEIQRAAISRALIVDPQILLMDEPFSALDIRTHSSLTAMIKKVVKDNQTTCIHVTHNFSDVWNLAENVAVMKDGQILQQGRVKDVFSKPSHSFVADFVGVQNILDGKVIGKEGVSAKIKINEDLIIYSADEAYFEKNPDFKNPEKVLVAIRPENIIFSNQIFESSVRNQIRGTVKETIEIGPTVWMEVDVNGVIFKGMLTPSSFELLNIQKGKKIYLSFKSLNVKIIDCYDTFNSF